MSSDFLCDLVQVKRKQKNLFFLQLYKKKNQMMMREGCLCVRSSIKCDDEIPFDSSLCSM